MDDTVECRMCYRRAQPQLRAVCSGLIMVCPHCLAPSRPGAAGESPNPAPRRRQPLPASARAGG